MAITDSHGLAIAANLANASPHETTLTVSTIPSRFIAAKPHKLIGDNAYDSDPLDAILWREHGIELIAAQPH